ncbi:MAG: ribonuclease J [Alphaproteobacteria bacterium]|nr:ribonuclease J [Alphaproteobacteria bacterium]
MTERATAKDELVMVALGGLGEIGMNVYLYGLGPAEDRRWLMVDLGLTFPGEQEPGVDVVLPELKFIAEQAKQLDAIVITHAHEDHIGAVIESWPQLRCPIYATPFTIGMLKAKLAEFGGALQPEIREIPIDSRFTAGSFDLEFVSMAHSIPETSGVVIRTPLGTVFHTADWKLDDRPLIGRPTNVERIRQIGEEGVLALVCDSTNAFRDGVSPSEADVAQSLSGIIAAQAGQVALTTFASNLARIYAASEAAEANDRRLIVAGRSLHRVIQVGMDTGYLPEDFSYLDQEHFAYMERGEALVIATGSQGEPRAAMARISEGNHRDIQLNRGDTVIYSSRTIPGNEKEVLAVQNRLAERGLKVITDADGLVHVTGHPRREELARMFDWIKPEILVPMHGEVRHLQENARLAKDVGIPHVRLIVNGELLRLAPGKPDKIDEVPVGRRYRDGKLVVSDGENAVRERRRLAIVGLVAVAMAVDQRGNVIGDLDVAIDGVPDRSADGKLMEDIILDAVDGTIDSIPPKRRKDTEMLREAIRRAVRSAVDSVWGKKPIVKVLLAEVRTKA